MKITRLWQLTISFIAIVFIGFLFFADVIKRTSENRISLIFVILSFFVLWFIPNILSITYCKKHFLTDISSLLFVVFQIIYWVNVIQIIVPVHDMKIRFLINFILLLFGVSGLLINIRFETKPITGPATKSESKHLLSSVMELETAVSCLPELNNEIIEGVKKELADYAVNKKIIIHGIDINILNECRLIRNFALCKDYDSAALHSAILSQIVNLINGNSVEKVRGLLANEYKENSTAK